MLSLYHHFFLAVDDVEAGLQVDGRRVAAACEVVDAAWLGGLVGRDACDGRVRHLPPGDVAGFLVAAVVVDQLHAHAREAVLLDVGEMHVLAHFKPIVVDKVDGYLGEILREGGVGCAGEGEQRAVEVDPEVQVIGIEYRAVFGKWAHGEGEAVVALLLPEVAHVDDDGSVGCGGHGGEWRHDGRDEPCVGRQELPEVGVDDQHAWCRELAGSVVIVEREFAAQLIGGVVAPRA